MGLAALEGVKVRTGNFINPGERVVSGLVQRFGLCDYVSDNAGSFKGKVPPRHGVFISLGEHKVYVGVDITDVYPHQVVVAGEPPLNAASRRSRARLAGSVSDTIAAVWRRGFTSPFGFGRAREGRTYPCYFWPFGF